MKLVSNHEGRVAQELMEMGISLIDPAPQIAKMVTSLADFKALLNASPLSKRKKAYEALKPHLSFRVPPYSLMGLRARATRERPERRVEQAVPCSARKPN